MKPSLFLPLLARARSLPPVRSIALMGDSMSSQNSSNLVSLNAPGYGTWARVLTNSAFDFEPNGGVLNFAAGGKRSDELNALYLSAVCASAADLVVEQAGFNDAAQAVATATVVANRRAAWAAIRAAGKKVIACTTTPAALAYVGNSGGVVSARISDYNAAIRIAAVQDGVPVCDVGPLLETVPGSNSGIGDPQFFDGTIIHPNSLGANVWGRALGVTLNGCCSLPVDPLANVNYLTPNANFAAGSPTPTNYSSFPASNGANGTQAMVTYSGVKWWQLQMLKQTSTGIWTITNSAANTGGSPAGKTIDAVCQLRVTSGVLLSASLTAYTNPSVTSVAYDLFANVLGTITPADGIVTIRTPKVALAGDRTLVWPNLTCCPLGADCSIEIRVLTVRQFAP